MRIALGSLLVVLTACQPAGGPAEPGPAAPTVETQEAEPAPPSGPIVLG
jgi:hypothetical protein